MYNLFLIFLTSVNLIKNRGTPLAPTYPSPPIHTHQQTLLIFISYLPKENLRAILISGISNPGYQGHGQLG